jgi:hypothetical protein
MFSFGNGVVSWSSKKRPIVALLNTEAKYRGAAIATCEVVWLQKLLSDLGQLVDAFIVIYCDNIHVNIEDQIADIFTKALGINKLKKFQKNA